jgi:hypothetical protein
MPYPTPTAESSSGGVLERTQSYDTAVHNQVHHQSQQQQLQTSQTQPEFLSTTTGPMQTTQDQTQTFTQSVFSPTFNFSPLPAGIAMPNDFGQYDALYSGQGFDHQTPSGLSASAESAHTDPDKDPFLSLLEQLAENDGAGGPGMADLDFFLNGQGLGGEAS